MRKKKKMKLEEVDYGSMEFYCKQCKYTFQIDWATIWDIQESTHGFVGLHINDTFISCPKCDEICEQEEY